MKVGFIVGIVFLFVILLIIFSVIVTVPIVFGTMKSSKSKKQQRELIEANEFRGHFGLAYD